MTSYAVFQRDGVRGLVLDALEWKETRHILADFLEEVDDLFAERLRCFPTYELTLAALSFGRWRDKEAWRESRGMVRAYASEVRRRRLMAVGAVAITPVGDGRYRVPPFERCRGDSCWCMAASGWFFPHILRLAAQSRHIGRMVWRGLNGFVVSHDVEGNLGELREEIRARIAREGY